MVRTSHLLLARCFILQSILFMLPRLLFPREVSPRGFVLFGAFFLPPMCAIAAF